MPKDLLADFEPEEAEATVDEDPAKDITLEDLGEDKELNTPPEKESPDQEEFEEDKPEEAEEEPKKEPEAEKKETAVQAAEKTEADKTTEEILKYLGMESTLKIKGREYKLSDFSKEDLLAYIQKGTRMTQIGQELSKKEQLLAERERQAEANALQATQLINQHRAAVPAGKTETEPPKELQPSEYDTDDVKAVKQAALTVWKQNQEQAQRLNAIESGLQSQQTEAQTEKVMQEINTHMADYPLAMVEQVIAVHALRPDIPLDDLTRRSHAIIGSVDHVHEVFKHAPEVRKQIQDEIIADYLARNSKAKVIPQKPSAQGSRQAPAAKAKVGNFDQATQAAKRALARMIEGQEADND